MNFRPESTKINFKEYLLLAIGIIVYLLIGLGGYGLDLFSKEINFYYVAFVGLGVIACTAFLLYYLRNNVN